MLINMFSNCSKILFVMILLIGFYHYFKAWLFKISPTIASYVAKTQRYPFNQIVSATELSLVAIFHLFFCLSLLVIFDINLKDMFRIISVIDCIYACFIGIGTVGIAVLICTIVIKCLAVLKPNEYPKSLSAWSAIAHAGWIRHHKHTIIILPLALALLVITIQIGAEETIFRGVLLQVFASLGLPSAFFLSILLFVSMQIFHMPSYLSAMFPMVGALIMGLIHTTLYIHQPSIVPLIISHLAFFIFTIS